MHIWQNALLGRNFKVMNLNFKQTKVLYYLFLFILWQQISETNSQDTNLPYVQTEELNVQRKSANQTPVMFNSSEFWNN